MISCENVVFSLDLNLQLLFNQSVYRKFSSCYHKSENFCVVSSTFSPIFNTFWEFSLQGNVLEMLIFKDFPP